MATLLPATDLQAYQTQGFCRPQRAVLPAARFDALHHRTNELLQMWSDHYGQRPEAFDKPHFLFPELFDFLFDPAVLDLVEPVIGPDIALFSSHFICKPPGTGQRVPWHEDSAYWSGIFDRIDDVCTLWLALDRSDSANGCLRVVAGSHHGGFSAYAPVPDQERSVFGTEISSPIDPSRIIDLELEPNHCSIHHARIIHGSEANHSSRRRCGLSIRYVSTRCRFLRGPLPESFSLYLARGRDHAGNRYADPRVVNQAWVEDMLNGRLPPDSA